MNPRDGERRRSAGCEVAEPLAARVPLTPERVQLSASSVVQLSASATHTVCSGTVTCGEPPKLPITGGTYQVTEVETLAEFQSVSV